MYNADLSDEAIMKRWQRATEMAVVTVNKTLFDSLQDIPDLLKERAMLLKRSEEMNEPKDEDKL